MTGTADFFTPGLKPTNQSHTQSDEGKEKLYENPKIFRQSSVLTRTASLFMKPSPHFDEVHTQKAAVLQKYARIFIYRKLRLDRRNLVDRLRHEHFIFSGTLRLLNLLIIFTLLLVSLSLSENTQTKNGIRYNLDQAFDIERIEETSTLEGLWETMAHMSESSKQFAPLSSDIFEDEYSTVEVQTDLAVFKYSQSVSQDTAVIQASALQFSMVAWVGVSERFSSGYILRKRIANSGPGTELCCWGWYLNATHGQRLHFGAHDHYNMAQDPASIILDRPVSQQQDIGLPASASTGWRRDELSFLTLVVTQTSVKFYYNLELAGEMDMPRPITDCYNPSGLMLGDEGLTLGQVRVYHSALDHTHIQEIYQNGAKLRDMAWGVSPRLVEDTDIQRLESSLSGQIENLEQRIIELQGSNEQQAVLRTVLNEELHMSTSNEALSSGAGAEESREHLMQGEVEGAGVKYDTYSGRQYHSLIPNPVLLDMPTEDEVPRYFNRTTLPSFAGTGASFTYWLQPAGGSYMFSGQRSANTAYVCWGFWMDTASFGFWADVPSGPSEIFVQQRMVPDVYLPRDGEWCHLAVVMDPDTDKLMVYLNGYLMVDKQMDFSIGDLDCPVGDEGENPVIGVGHAFPGWTWGGEISLADVRVYIGAALTPDQILTIASNDDLDLSPKCIPKEELSDSVEWRDINGEGCDWYAANKAENENICDCPEVKEQCTLTCGTGAWCWNNDSLPRIYYIWDCIQQIEKKTPNGTICLGDKFNAEDVVSQCRERNSNTGLNSTFSQDTFKKYLTYPYDSPSRLDISDCDQLEAAIDPSCTFKSSEVDAFTADVLENGGDYSIVFWVKSAGQASLDLNTGRFLPVLVFFADLVGLKHNLMMTAFDGSNMVVFASACEEEEEKFIYIQVVPEDDDWALITIVRTNTTHPTSVRAGMNANAMYQPGIEGAEWNQCLFTEDFVRGIELPVDMFTSPIALIPKALNVYEQQKFFYRSSPLMRLREGALHSNRTRMSAVNHVSKGPFIKRQVSVTPPVVFQQRTLLKETCPHDFANRFIESLHQTAIQYKCQHPNQCEEDVVQHPSSIVPCVGGIEDEKPFFGKKPMMCLGIMGYADFLYVLTDNKFLNRAGDFLSTPEFVDHLTQLLYVYFVYFSPESGTISLMEVEADLSQIRRVTVEVKVSHYSVLEDRELVVYLVAQSFNLLFVLFLFLDNLKTARFHIQAWRHWRKYPSTLQMVELPLDFVVGFSIMFFVALRIRDRSGSADTVETILKRLGGIPWGETDVSPDHKTMMFFDGLNYFLEVNATEASMNSLCNILLMMLLLRVILATNVHPRLALLTGTIGRSLDDMWHTTLLVVTLNCSFAAIATWRFGADHDNFVTIMVTMQTQFEMLMGEFPDNWTSSNDMLLYVVLYLLVLFVLVLNFVLAIIVEAYMTLREVNEINEIELEFIADFLYCCLARIRGYLYKWPAPLSIAEGFHKIPSKHTVGLPDLTEFGKFEDQISAVRFLHHYRQLSCLQPKPIIKNEENDKMVREIETRMAWLLGKPVPTMQDHISCMTKTWKKKAKRHSQIVVPDEDPNKMDAVLRNICQHLSSPKLLSPGSSVSIPDCKRSTSVPTHPTDMFPMGDASFTNGNESLQAAFLKYMSSHSPHNGGLQAENSEHTLEDQVQKVSQAVDWGPDFLMNPTFDMNEEQPSIKQIMGHHDVEQEDGESRSKLELNSVDGEQQAPNTKIEVDEGIKLDDSAKDETNINAADSNREIEGEEEDSGAATSPMKWVQVNSAFQNEAGENSTPDTPLNNQHSDSDRAL